MIEAYSVDKRRVPRFQINLPIRNGNPDDQRFSRTFDISATGVGLISDHELPLGEPLQLCLFMPDNNEEIRLQGKAVWISMSGSSRFRIGVSLDEPRLKPIPLVLRSIRMRCQQYG